LSQLLMTPEETSRLKACSAEIAAILQRNSDPANLTDLASIEHTVRQQMLEHVSPEVALFLSDVPPDPSADGAANSKV
jgi:hypothetical protein